jgi:hypothetical protein
MSLPKKGLRKITVDNFCYAWSATGNDDFISLSVVPFDKEGQLLSTAFGYHAKAVGETYTSDGHKTIHTKQQLVITPYIVRQVIEYALQKGWNPQKKGPQLRLHVEAAINLRLAHRV